MHQLVKNVSIHSVRTWGILFHQVPQASPCMHPWEPACMHGLVNKCMTVSHGPLMQCSHQHGGTMHAYSLLYQLLAHACSFHGASHYKHMYLLSAYVLSPCR